MNLGLDRFSKNLKYQVSSKYVQWGLSCSMQTGGRTERQTDGHGEANSRFSQFFERP
jgi:hypothetical protein